MATKRRVKRKKKVTGPQLSGKPMKRIRDIKGPMLSGKPMKRIKDITNVSFSTSRQGKG